MGWDLIILMSVAVLALGALLVRLLRKGPPPPGPPLS